MRGNSSCGKSTAPCSGRDYRDGSSGDGIGDVKKVLVDASTT